MAQKAITVYTPPEASAHIYAEDQAQINRARIGNGGSGISDADSILTCTKVNDNTVRLSSGVYYNQGYDVVVPGGTTEDLSVDSGTAGQYRKDLVVSHFIKGGGATGDTHILEVKKGIPAASLESASDPALEDDDLSTGGTEREEALYRLTISGSTLSAITRIAPIIGTYA